MSHARLLHGTLETALFYGLGQEKKRSLQSRLRGSGKGESLSLHPDPHPKPHQVLAPHVPKPGRARGF